MIYAVHVHVCVAKKNRLLRNRIQELENVNIHNRRMNVRVLKFMFKYPIFRFYLLPVFVQENVITRRENDKLTFEEEELDKEPGEITREIVKVSDGAHVLPLDALTHVLLLLLFQDELDEELLQLLVTVVDAELLEAAIEMEGYNGVINDA